MSWFWPRRAVEPAASALEPEPEVHRSLALATLFAGLDPERRIQIIDLGPAVGANLEYLTARFLCKFFVGDLYRSLLADGARFSDPETDHEALLRGALPAVAAPFDLVLAWDLFDYLTRRQIRALSTVLADLCRPGGQLFAMVSIGTEIPASPGTFVFHDAETIIYRDRSAATRPAPRYRPSDVAELTPGFTVDRTYLLRHGVQEYLLVRDEG